MIDQNLIKLAKQNLKFFHNESDLADYIAFLFSELIQLDSDWENTIAADIAEMESAK